LFLAFAAVDLGSGAAVTLASDAMRVVLVP
jgi:hypothetical protein